MMNIAIPIFEIEAKNLRALERRRLKESDVIKQDEKTERLQAVADSIDEAKKSYAQVRKDVRNKNLSEEKEKAKLLDIDIAEDSAIHSYNETAVEISRMLTNEDRDARLIELQAQDDLYAKSYGPQPMTSQEIEQKNTDEVAHDEYVKNRKYIDDRVREYPSTGDQLDMIWKALAAIGSPLPPEAAEMLKTINLVKSKNPGPKDV